MKSTESKTLEREEGLAAQAGPDESSATPSVKTPKNGRTPQDTSNRLVGYTRFMAAVPSFGLFIAAVAMTLSTLLSTVGVTIEVIKGELTMQDMLVEYIEYADFFLLSIVLYIMSVGLYSLFIDDKIEMPSWLEIHTLDDLKEKLVSVIVVVMGVDNNGTVTGISVGGSDFAETANLGTRTREPEFTDRFPGLTSTPVMNENVDAISGVTVSSSAVISGAAQIYDAIAAVE